MGWLREWMRGLSDSGPLEDARTHAARRSGSGTPGDFVVRFSAGEAGRIAMDWPGVVDGERLTTEDARRGFLTWLRTAPREGDGPPTRSLRARLDGRDADLTFRADLVTDFTVEARR